MGDHAQIVVAGYRDWQSAQLDFNELSVRAKHKRLEFRSAALVSKGPDGVPAVTQAANHHGRTGAGWGAGVGMLLGLFAPPLAAAVVVGAVAGGLVASFAEHEVTVGLRREVGQALEAGTAVVLVLVAQDGSFAVQRALPHAVQTSVLSMDETTINRLDQAVAQISAVVAPAASGQNPTR